MKQTGEYYEQLAADFLVSQGATILETNFRCKLGEIDIIAQLEKQLIFVEVKYRKNDNFGSAISHVTPAKQQRIRRTAAVYLKQTNASLACRFDVIGFTGQQPIEWVNNAF